MIIHREYPFPWRWESSRYSQSYIASGVTEAVVQASALASLRAQGHLAWAVDSGAKAIRGRAAGALRAAGLPTSALVGRTGAGMKGHSDIVGVYRPTGRAIFIEVKRPGENPTQAQLDFLHAVFQAGAIAGVVWSGLDVIPILNQGETNDED